MPSHINGKDVDLLTPPSHLLPQALHMARIASKTDPSSYTILINPDSNWHQQTNPFTTQFKDTHVITYIPPNTLQYHTTLAQPYDKQIHIENLAIQILCIHHKTTTLGDILKIQKLHDFLPNIPLHIQIAPPTPPHTKVQIHKTWHTHLDLPTLIYTYNNTYPLPTYTFALSLKFPPKYSYYTDGSFKPPKQISANNWRPETAAYGIYGPIKDLQISERLHGLQNILRAELMAIYITIKLSSTTYTEEPLYIFTDSLNSLYLINTQLRHPSAHNNHPDKTILSQIASMLVTRTQPTELHKVKAHANITGNEIVDALAKEGHRKPHSMPNKPHEYAYSTPYYLHKDEWIGMHYTPYKGPIRNFQRYLQKYTTDTHLTELANIHKWTSDTNIDKISSNAFWNNPQISESQIKQLIKFRTNQYMGNARKHLFWPLRYPNITCSLCSTNEVDTWPHVLLKCPQPHLHALRIKRHNKVVWELRKLITSSPTSRCMILMNVGYFNNNPPDNTVPQWLLPCTCSTQRCHCIACLRPDILCIQGAPYLGNPPSCVDPSLKIQFIEFTYTNDRSPADRVNAKIAKYQPLINDIQALGWKVAPIIIITAGARGTTHIPSITQLHTTDKYKKSIIKNTLINVNTIAIQYLTSIILHKCRLENHQPLPDPHGHP
jgi:ribonuclease HI